MDTTYDAWKTTEPAGLDRPEASGPPDGPPGPEACLHPAPFVEDGLLVCPCGEILGEAL